MPQTSESLSVGSASAVESSEHQQRAAVGWGDASARRRAGDGETLFKQRGQGGETVLGFEGLGTDAFVEDDAESGLVFERHLGFPI